MMAVVRPRAKRNAAVAKQRGPNSPNPPVVPGMDTKPMPETAAPWRPKDCERVALVLQGGGALGAYQGGVYEALHEEGIEPDWVSGVSIGAINAALIAGNRRADRLPALREFWRRITDRTLWVHAPDGDVYRQSRNAFSSFTPPCSASLASSSPRSSIPGCSPPAPRTPPVI